MDSPSTIGGASYLRRWSRVPSSARRPVSRLFLVWLDQPGGIRRIFL